MRRTPLLAAIVFTAALATPALAQDVVLKVHHFWPPGAMGPSTLLVPWCDKIARDSGNKGRVTPSDRLTDQCIGITILKRSCFCYRHIQGICRPVGILPTGVGHRQAH